MQANADNGAAAAVAEGRPRQQRAQPNKLPFSLMPQQRAGLYDPQQERDACGVGFIANFKSLPTHDLLQNALTMLARMDHRGGCGCEPNTGDGAGVMVGMPHSFLVDVALEELNVHLPPAEKYAVGNIFMPQDDARIEYWQARFEHYMAQRGLGLIGWRQVPVDNSMIGPSAARTEPVVMQLFVENSRDATPQQFDLELYVVKQCVSREAFDLASRVNKAPEVYVCTLNSSTLVYKGMLSAPQVREYYLDLQDPRFATHFALVHSRFSTNTFPSWDRAHPNRVLCHNGEINTLRGNKNWMFAREGTMESPFLQPTDAYPNPTELLRPVCSDHYSDLGQP